MASHRKGKEKIHLSTWPAIPYGKSQLWLSSDCPYKTGQAVSSGQYIPSLRLPAPCTLAFEFPAVTDSKLTISSLSSPRLFSKL